MRNTMTLILFLILLLILLSSCGRPDNLKDALMGHWVDKEDKDYHMYIDKDTITYKNNSEATKTKYEINKIDNDDNIIIIDDGTNNAFNLDFYRLSSNKKIMYYYKNPMLQVAEDLDENNDLKYDLEEEDPFINWKYVGSQKNP